MISASSARSAADVWASFTRALVSSLMAAVRGLLTRTSSGLARGPIATADCLGKQAQAAAPPSSSGSRRTYCLRAARVGMLAADALAHAHCCGIVHGDIKPSDLLVGNRGTLWVTDFGLANAIGEAKGLTPSGDHRDGFQYLPTGRLVEKSDARGDIYGLGMTLYELITLADAFHNVDRTVFWRRNQKAELLRPCRVNPDVPGDLETIVLKAIARDPSRRYQTAALLATDLRRFIEGRPIHPAL